MTPPYTGGNKGAIRDFDFDSSKDYILRVNIPDLNKVIDYRQNEQLSK